MVLRIISVYKLGIIPRRPQAAWTLDKPSKRNKTVANLIVADTSIVVQIDKYIFNPRRFDFRFQLLIYKENLFIDSKLARAYKYRLTGYNILYRQNRSKCTL